MAQEPKALPEEVWQAILVDGHKKLNRMRGLFRLIPSPPRCKECSSPFRGLGGRFVSIMGFRPSPMNPNFCDFCIRDIPAGGIEIDIGVLFADVRGSTDLSRKLGPKAYADLLNRFYKTANSVLLQHDALIDKMIGDEVMALFLPGFCGPEYRKIAAHAGEALIRAAQDGPDREPWLPLGVGVHVGPAYVGAVGGDGITDFTALGDTVNIAARLRSEARAGELLLSEEAYQAVADRHPDLEKKVLNLKGIDTPFEVRAFALGKPAAAAT
jgi:adenylate cyclase